VAVVAAAALAALFKVFEPWSPVRIGHVAVGAAAALLIEGASRHGRAAWVQCAIWAICAGALGRVLFDSSSAALAQLAGGLVAIAVGAGVVGVIVPRMSLVGGAFVWSLMYVGLIGCGRLFAELRWLPMALLLAAPLGGFIPVRGAWARGWKGHAVRIGAAAALAGGAALAAWLMRPSYEN